MIYKRLNSLSTEYCLSSNYSSNKLYIFFSNSIYYSASNEKLGFLKRKTVLNKQMPQIIDLSLSFQ